MKILQKAKEDILLLPVAGVSLILNFANLSIEGYGNEYYAAAVRSMLSSFRNFFFNSFDPAGFVSVDKPPVGLWIQSASAYLLGYSGWSVILPQALAGVMCVVMLYFMVKSSFGRPAGLIAALVLAVTPIFVATSRNNTMDNLMIFVVLSACWLSYEASHGNKPGLFILASVLIGIGFNIKMLQAYMVIPAVYGIFLLSGFVNVRKRVVYALMSCVLMVAVSLSWPLAVDQTPEDERPYAGSSQDNSVLELVFGHNGLKRLSSAGNGNLKHGTPEKAHPVDCIQNPGLPGPQETGRAGIARLFNRQLAAQAAWLLPLALSGLLLLPSIDSKKKTAVVQWFLYLVPMAVYFSFTTGLFHRYYLSTMAPATAALSGISAVHLWKEYKKGSTAGWALPAVILITAGIQAYIISTQQFIPHTLTAVVLVPAAIGFSVLLSGRICSFKIKDRLAGTACACAMTALLIAPAVWSLAPVIYGTGGNLPAAEFPDKRQKGMNGGINMNTSGTRLIHFLEENRAEAQFLAATVDAKGIASRIIIQTGEPVMAVGGFTGTDEILTLESFLRIVREGRVKYFLVPRQPQGKRIDMPPAGGHAGNAEIVHWVLKNGRPVDPRLWEERGLPGGGYILMDISQEKLKQLIY